MYLDGNAIVYCEGAFNTPGGKTAHGLVRFTRRYNILSVVDSRYAGQDAGAVIDQKPNGIPVLASIEEAIVHANAHDNPPQSLVIGLAPDGGRLPEAARRDVRLAIDNGLNVDSGLHDFLSDDPDLAQLARERGVRLRDIRKTPPRHTLHFFSGKIEEVRCLKIALLGTDSAVGKRTTAWILVQALEKAGYKAELIGTGQTAWMQGARHSIVLDSLINDFVSGELEHAVHQAWIGQKPHVIVVEGQGSLMNPAYPGGFEILAATRPDLVFLQHAPRRREYDGFPGYPIHPLPTQVQAVELLSGKKVVGITVNHEDMDWSEIPAACEAILAETGLPAFDPLVQGGEPFLEILKPWLPTLPI